MTIQTNQNAERDQRPVRGQEKKAELVCRVKYNNTLPDIPFDPKFLQYPFDSKRFISYNPTTLERNYKYEVLTEHDLGVTVDLVDKDVFNVEPGVHLDPADEKLLEEDVLTPQDSKRSRHHARSVSWLRRTEYISTEQTRFQPQTMEKVEAKVGYSIKKNFKEETVIMDRESQIKAIDKTFADSLLPIEKHYSKPNVHPVEVLPVFPDFQGWKYPCAQVIFDSDPAPVGRSVPAQIEEMSQAMIRGVMDESGEQFVAYFLPTEDTLEKRRKDFVNMVDYEDDQEYEYKMAREYNWNVKNKASKGYEENYFLVVRPDGIYYNELETRVRLNKRRQKPGQAPSNTRLVVKHRPVNEIEYRMQRFRERQLEPHGEEEEEEEEEPEMEQETITITRTGERNQESGDEQSGSDKNDSDNEKDNGSESDGVAKKKKNRIEDSESEKEERKSRSRSSTPKSRKSKGSGSSRSRSGSVASKKSRSGSPASSKSRSRSGSAASKKSRSRSGSPASKKSGSRSRSATPVSKKSGSRSRSGSPASKKSGSRSRSASAASKKSGSRSGSAASNKSRSRSGSPASAKSRSRSGSPATNKSRSRSGSAASSRSGGSNKSRSRSGSPAARTSRSRSASPASNKSRSRSGSPASNKSGSRSRSASAESKKSASSGSASGSASPAGGNRSASPASASSSGSDSD